ncbi:hypothetical protein PINS_up009702 [Pythium insidiosum]|nr:hypothetical protein PINS_up009702 [Pythium insidiosum]
MATVIMVPRQRITVLASCVDDHASAAKEQRTALCPRRLEGGREKKNVCSVVLVSVVVARCMKTHRGQEEDACRVGFSSSRCIARGMHRIRFSLNKAHLLVSFAVVSFLMKQLQQAENITACDCASSHIGQSESAVDKIWP